MINASCRVALLESLVLGHKLGLSLQAMADVINVGPAASFPSRAMLPAMLAGRPASNFALSLMLKDLTQATNLGMETGAPMPISNIVRGLVQIGVNTVGSAAKLDDLVPLVERMGATTLTSLPPTAATPEIAGIVVEALAACNQLITWECVAMGSVYGLTIPNMAKVINDSSAWNEASEKSLPSFAVGKDMCHGTRIAADLRRATALGGSVGAPLLIANALRTTRDIQPT
jgi:3-hydroxyisobutyrate dehydrogenase